MRSRLNRYKLTVGIHLGLTVCVGGAMAQGVTIGSSTPPDPSAILDLQTANQGFLMPRLTTLQRNAIVSPAIGLQIYNLDNQCVETYFPSGWKPLGCDCVTPPAAPAAVAGPSHVCEGASQQTFVVQSVPGAINYVWTIDAQDTLVSGQGNDTIVISFSNQSGMRTISVFASNPCGNSSAYQFTVNVSNPDSTYSISPSPVYTTGPSTFTANESGATYAWTFTGGSPSTGSNQAESVHWSVAGTYTVNLVVTDPDGCVSSSTTNITVSNCQPISHTFTNCGQTGRTGPSQTQCDNVYGAGFVTVVSGVQQWTVPATGTYRIQAVGAAGGKQLYSSGYDGGLGASVQGEFSLTAGTVLNILVGQKGEDTRVSNQDAAAPGGGGGTFVYLNAGDALPLLAAGGGGGGGRANGSTRHASISTSGQNSSDGAPGGINGNGGQPNSGGSSYWAGGGAGWLTDGTGGNNGSAYNFNPGTTGAGGGRRPANGGLGGTRYNDGLDEGGDGGFGGGGGGGSDNMGTGGGGGFSGGAGARGGSANHTGGGGGSYNGGANPVNQVNVNSGHGYVVITRICQ